MASNKKIVPKADLTIRKVGSRYMIVDASDSCVNLTDVYSLNETAARIWEMICKGEAQTPEKLAEGLCREYEVEYGHALHDVERQLDEWEKMGLL